MNFNELRNGAGAPITAEVSRVNAPPVKCLTRQLRRSVVPMVLMTVMDLPSRRACTLVVSTLEQAVRPRPTSGKMGQSGRAALWASSWRRVN
jgi:hypothetical protein